MHNGIIAMPALPAPAAIHADVARLLADAQSALARDPDAALRYIARASALLVSHFTRLFRRFLGMTPHAWRRARRETPRVPA